MPRCRRQAMRRDAELDGGAESELLHWILSDEYIVLTKMRNFRAELEACGFHGQRDLMDSHCRELCRLIDQVDQSLRACGGRPLGTLKEFLDHARLKAPPDGRPDVRSMMADLLTDHEILLDRLRPERKLGLLEEVAQGHERMAWTLRILLEARGPHERRR